MGFAIRPFYDCLKIRLCRQLDGYALDPSRIAAQMHYDTILILRERTKLRNAITAAAINTA